MIDLTPIKAYYEEPSTFTVNFVRNQLTNKGLESLIEYDFRSIDCTRVSDNGLRMMQTIGSPYVENITELVHIISTYIEDDKQDEYYSRLLDIHNRNLEYEKENPPVWYGGDKAKRQYEKEHSDKSTTKQRKPKQQRIDFQDESKKPTAAERKLAAKVAKISKLNFNIKPINNGNTL